MFTKSRKPMVACVSLGLAMVTIMSSSQAYASGLIWDGGATGTVALVNIYPDNTGLAGRFEVTTSGGTGACANGGIIAFNQSQMGTLNYAMALSLAIRARFNAKKLVVYDTTSAGTMVNCGNIGSVSM